jgi:hypothetical protein
MIIIACTFGSSSSNMVKTLVESNVEWFKSEMKLPNHGLDILKKLVNDNIVSVADYEAIFGKGKRSNG